MSELRSRIKRLPVVGSMASMVSERLRRRRLRALSTEDVFTEIYQDNTWQGVESVSGTGSDDEQTSVLVAMLTRVLAQNDIHSMLDLPCGDFRWMQRVDLSGVHYTGADIVADLIVSNQKIHGCDERRFAKLDLIRDDLPKVDLVFCRDCLVHLSEPDIWMALDNICRSGSKFLLTTTFVAHPVNAAIETGQWRTINLESAPFLLPPPEQLISEECTEAGGAYADKSLGLWRVETIRDHLQSLTRKR